MCFTPYGLYSPWRDGGFSSHMIIGFMLPFGVHVQVCMQGECTGCTSTPQPKKSSAQKHPKEEEKFCPDMLAKKNAHSAQIQQN